MGVDMGVHTYKQSVMRSFINELQFDTNPVVQKGEIAPGKAVVDSVIVQTQSGQSVEFVQDTCAYGETCYNPGHGKPGRSRHSQGTADESIDWSE